MSGLKIRLLGPPQIELNGVLIELGRRKSLALLTYLAVTGHRQRRDTLATMLWPENGQSDARRALRRDLSDLNRALDGTWLETERESVGLRSGFCLDVNQFQEYLASHTESVHESVSRLEKAFELYRDDFLAGFSLSDSPEFDDWQAFQTEGLHQSFLAGLDRIVLLLREQNQVGAAIPYARRRVSLDLLCEPAHRQLMQLYAETGQQTLALRQYELCREHLNKELSVPPEEETTALFQHIKSRNVLVVDSSPAVSIPLPVLKSHHHNLPTQTTTFVGRDGEIAEIQHLLTNESGCRLLTLIGPGGIGKTRLALVAARKVLDAFRDGVYFIELAQTDEIEDVILAVAEALNFVFYDDSDPREQLLSFLQQKELLLVLDNFEHLLDSVAIIADILSHAVDVKLMVTSRERLYLQEEWLYEVQGLSFPRGEDRFPASSITVQDLGNYTAVELFVQRARQLDRNFIPATDEILDIARICQLVAGVPLGLELAATWIRTLRCGEIVTEIENSLSFLKTSMRNIPERHRSLHVVFEQTWERLLQEDQDVLMLLSVFRGSFTREAAEAVTDATLPVLSSLVDKALVRRTNTGRYELHELTRQFAGEKLNLTGNYEKARARHEAYFVSLSEEEIIRLRSSVFRLSNSDDNTSNALDGQLKSLREQKGLRVLIISPEYPPHTWSGRGKHVAGLVPALGRIPFEDKFLLIDVIVPIFGHDGYVESSDSAITIYHVSIPIATNELENHVLFNNSLLIKQANLLLQHRDYKLIHIHDVSVSKAGIALKKQWNLPLITTIHSTVKGFYRSIPPSETNLYEQLEQQVCDESDQIIVTSRFMQQEVHRHLGVPYERISIVANGTNVQTKPTASPEKLAAFREQYISTDQRLLLYVGHATYEKGLLTLIRAMPKITTAHPNISLVVISKHGNKLYPLAYELNVESAICFLDYVSGDHQQLFYQIADAVVIPSIYEPFGAVALEAMALDCNVLASNVGGLKEVIAHERTGLLFTPNSPESIVQAVDRLFADPIAAQQRRHNALHEVKTTYNWITIAAQTAKIYESLIAQ